MNNDERSEYGVCVTNFGLVLMLAVEIKAVHCYIHTLVSSHSVCCAELQRYAVVGQVTQ